MQPDHTVPVGIESRISEWLGKKGSSLVTVFLAVSVALTSFATYRSYQRRQATSALFEAHELAQRLSSPDHPEAATALQALIDRYPAVEDLYRSTLLHSSLQAVWTKGSFSPVKDPSFLSSSSPEEEKFVSYSKTSFAIARGDYQRALEETSEQKRLLMLSGSDLPTLEIFLLLRLVSLYHQLGNQKEAATHWQELLAKRESHPALFSTFATHLREGAIDVGEYPIYQ